MASSSVAVAGGLPTVDLDVPILAVFIFLFVCLAASHMTIFQMNRRRGHWFIFNGAIFGFCMSRLGACVLRMVWAFYPDNPRVSLAAQVFLNAGILIVYLVNNFLVQRLLRSSHPRLGWNPVFRLVYKILLYLIIPIIIVVIVTVVQEFYTNSAYTRRIDGDLIRFGLTYFLVIAFLPLFLLPIAAFWPRRQPRDEFGAGSWNTKIAIAFVATSIGCIEAGFRAGINWSPARPASDPAWYDSKASFYCFNFSLDILVVLLYLVVRIDRRFHVPNKANGPGSYSSYMPTTKEKQLYDTDFAFSGSERPPRSPAFAASGREARMSGMTTPWNGSVSSRRSSAPHHFQCPECASTLYVSSVRPGSVSNPSLSAAGPRQTSGHRANASGGRRDE